MKDRTSRLLRPARPTDRELRLREFGTKQAAWVKLLRADELEADEAIATLGPEAWPDPPEDFAALLRAGGARPLHGVLRDQRVIAGIGRSWVDEILWTARAVAVQARRRPRRRRGGAPARGDRRRSWATRSRVYEEIVKLPIPDKLPLPLKVHRRNGEPCPRCGATIEAVHYEDYVMCYCPQEQTGGRVLKDRRLSRLLK